MENVKVSVKVGKFDGTEYSFLSNFYPCEVEYEGLVFPSSEHAYVSAKTEDMRVKKFITYIKTPGEVKRYGRTLTIRKDWDEVKVQKMTQIVMAKFEQNPFLGEMLLNTGDMILEEGNTWGDKFWGICPPLSGMGENNLGKILMLVRGALRNSG